MSYYATRVRTLRFNGDHLAVTYPTTLRIDAVLSPEELFQEPPAGSPRVVFETGVAATLTVNPLLGRVDITPPTKIPPLNLARTTPAGDITFEGCNLHLAATINSIADLAYCVDYVSINIAQFLSVEFQLFVDVVSMQGQIGDIAFDLFYPFSSMGVQVVTISEVGRIEFIDSALSKVDRRSTSFHRLAVALGYFHHALRLSSPHEVSFPRSIVYGEVMLNLAKCLEVLAKSDSREHLRSFAKSIGLTPSETESQVVPIALMRNEIDIAHAVASPATDDQLSTYKRYVERSLENVASIIHRTFERIQQEDTFLAPIPVVRNASRERFCQQLKTYLDKPAISRAKA